MARRDGTRRLNGTWLALLGALVLASLGGLLGCEEQPDPYFIDGTSIGEVTFTPDCWIC